MFPWVGEIQFLVECFCQKAKKKMILKALKFVEKNKSKCLGPRINVSDPHRFIPYCSSDVWTGTGPAPTPPTRQRQGRDKIKERNTNTSKDFSNKKVCSLPFSCSLLISLLLHSAEYSFMGSLIIREVIKDLIPKGIKMAKVIMLAGTRWVFFCFSASAACYVSLFGPPPFLELTLNATYFGAFFFQH